MLIRREKQGEMGIWCSKGDMGLTKLSILSYSIFSRSAQSAG